MDCILKKKKMGIVTQLHYLFSVKLMDTLQQGCKLHLCNATGIHEEVILTNALEA
jgi:hypothetical protein